MQKKKLETFQDALFKKCGTVPLNAQCCKSFTDFPGILWMWKLNLLEEKSCLPSSIHNNKVNILVRFRFSL